MTEASLSDAEAETLAKVIGNVLTLSANESLVMAQLEAHSFYSPMPASLPLGGGSSLEESLDRLSAALGGPPRLVLLSKGEQRPQFDTYASAVIKESINAFMRARASTCRTHIYLIGSALIKRQPELMHLPDDPNIQRILISQVEERFWEHAEASYIRLASFWDRLGQVLDFAFFNIRQYERDGFSAVVDRIRSNFQPLSSEISASPAWKRLKLFHGSEQKDGLKWLLRRRNLLIHSLHLAAPAANETENPIFTSTYNHLETAVRKKLRVGTPEEELDQVHQHLKTAALLFSDTIELALIGASINRSPR